MKLRITTTRGFTLTEMMIVVAIIGLLAAIAVPSYVRARSNAQRSACINNLREMDGAVQVWAIENKRSATDSYTLDVVRPYLKLNATNEIPPCPANGTYAPGVNVCAGPTCTIPGHELPNSYDQAPATSGR
jgi:prepilin-type N-terminal cleavage/methylation domain-containing protein